MTLVLILCTSGALLQQSFPWTPVQPGLLWLVCWLPTRKFQEWVPVLPGSSHGFTLQVQWGAHGLSEQGSVLPHHSPWSRQQCVPQSQGKFRYLGLIVNNSLYSSHNCICKGHQLHQFFVRDQASPSQISVPPLAPAKKHWLIPCWHPAHCATAIKTSVLPSRIYSYSGVMRPECDESQLSSICLTRVHGKKRGVRSGVLRSFKMWQSVSLSDISNRNTHRHTYSLQITDDTVRRKGGFGVINEMS